MKPKIIFTSTRLVENAESILIGLASYKGPEPFSGMFQVFDADECIYINQVRSADGQRLL